MPLVHKVDKAKQTAEQSASYQSAEAAPERKSVAPTIITSFTPSIMGEATLRAIFVARQPLVDRIVRDIRDATTTGARRHALLIGPRGIGKTHLVSMVYYGVRAEPEVYDHLHIAWLREEDWTVFSWADLLIAIFRALANEYPMDRAELFRIADRLRRLSVAEGAAEGEQKLLEYLGDRLLLLIAENVNDLFEGMERDGQQSLRAFLQNHSNAVLVTTAPALTDDLSDYDAPFYGFFNTTHLKELTRDEARELLLKIARTNGAPDDLIEYLQTDEADRRLRVIEALAGGHPRIWILFSACMTKQLLDELVPLFVKMLDDLTPYYQERMRALPPQERRIVAFLCEKRGAVPVKEIAEACRLKPNAAAALLGKLEEKAYVQKAAEPLVVSVGDRRISYYEMREPLMRLCIEVKENRAEPLSLIVEFLRLWYGEEQIAERLKSVPEFAATTRLYMIAALKRASTIRNEVNILLKSASINFARDQYSAALKKLFNAVNLDPENDDALFDIGKIFWIVGNSPKALEFFDRVIAIVPNDSASHVARCSVLIELARTAEYISDINKLLLSEENGWIDIIDIAIDSSIAYVINMSDGVDEAEDFAMDMSIVFKRHNYTSLLSQGIIRSLKHLVSETIPVFIAERYAFVWRNVSNEISGFEVALRLLQAAVKWKETRDRGVLLRLPIEERTVLESLLPKDTDIGASP